MAWGGTLGNTAEVWTNSLKFVPASNQNLTAAQAQAAMPNIFLAVKNWFGNPTFGGGASFIGKDAKISWIKMNQVLATGLQPPGDTNVYETTPVVGGGGESSFVPFYQTYAISLMTALKRGRAHIGRIYPPCVIAPPIAGTGLQDPLNAASQATAFASLLTGLKAQIVPAFAAGDFAVCSPGNSVKGTVPMAATITGCTVDTVPDTQHRRTNRLKGTRSALSPSS